jgi:hypothetical protein
VSTVAVVTSSPPFVEGGHLVIARALVAALQQAGHEADLVLTPQNRFGRQGSRTWRTGSPMSAHVRRPADRSRHLAAVPQLRRATSGARVLAEPHDARVLRPLGSLQHTAVARAPHEERVRRALIHRADRYLLTRNVSKLFVQSETIRQRYAAWPELKAEVLYPPPPQRPYRVDDYEPYLFSVSRFAPLKRMR